MIAGQELDALIEETVMGGRTCDHKWYLGASGSRCRRCYKFERPFSTDISAALEVAEQFGRWNLRRQKNLFGGWEYVFQIGDKAGGAAPTVAHAICLAALRTVGIDATEY